MAAIAPSALLLFTAATFLVRADQAHDVLDQIHHVATALSDGNAADAMTPFDKSFRDYDKLRDYFDALTRAFTITNEADVTDEQDAPNETKLTLQWSLTLTNAATGLSSPRGREVKARLVLKNGKWKILDFEPIDLFDPQLRPGE